MLVQCAQLPAIAKKGKSLGAIAWSYLLVYVAKEAIAILGILRESGNSSKRISKHCKDLFIQNATAAWRRSRRNGLNKTN